MVKTGLYGMYMTVPQWMLVRYRYQGLPHQLFCSDSDPVKLPKTAHRVSDVAQAAQ